MSLDALLKQAAQELHAAGSTSPRVDAEVLMCHVLERDRTWLYTWGDKACPPREQARFEALVAARAQGTPVAYLTGEREFWGLRFATAPSTLIPRPDTETLVELALSRVTQPTGRLLDLGTGTGAIALAFASEQPGWQVLGVDVREEAVELAIRNARTLGFANARFIQSDWFAALEACDETDKRFDMIVSNPPYIAADDPHLAAGDVQFEPRSALVADAEGMADLLYLVQSAQSYLTASGWLLLEHGYSQADKVRKALKSAGYQSVESMRDLGGHERVTLGHL
ncbi:peptide chain release factor N(5)-glutamine methyltransferase [Halomonas sp. SpR8]|uniref:peptide chain release factor N(5)-glutamine methyltransferase n=1 Tax=Halomonas sp. SpR8 TaxID=3050463 RepID=UPI0027E5A9BE|nr:peptide chain release factor N(5)-glutamine methyltransferase [Halomonas sp. SpR8]MDQ7728562.1 peptide chain release factor N(5)-glutamine methyltransferase [Halomonas sp. SpR8]